MARWASPSCPLPPAVVIKGFSVLEFFGFMGFEYVIVEHNLLAPVCDQKLDQQQTDQPRWDQPRKGRAIQRANCLLVGF
jgi:hypothetical protein